MKHIIKKLALLFVPVYLWFAFFVAFEPNNYFGIKKTASSSQPVARVRAYEQSQLCAGFRQPGGPHSV